MPCATQISSPYCEATIAACKSGKASVQVVPSWLPPGTLALTWWMVWLERWRTNRRKEAVSRLRVINVMGVRVLVVEYDGTNVPGLGEKCKFSGQVKK
ncbi:MAG: hypothetical protein HY842_01645 [Bacteroidetes bacterium]|nr:hypothetical protein [Bacteroidota bacterium]